MPGPVGAREPRLQALGCLTLAFADGAPHLGQRRGGRVADVAEAVDDRLDAAHDLGEGLDAVRQVVQRRVVLPAPTDKLDDRPDERQRPLQEDHLGHIEERTGDAQFGDDLVRIGILAAREVALHVEQQAHLVGQRQAPFDLLRRGGKGFGREQLARSTHGTTGRDLLTQAVEADLLFKRSGINHFSLWDSISITSDRSGSARQAVTRSGRSAITRDRQRPSGRSRIFPAVRSSGGGLTPAAARSFDPNLACPARSSGQGLASTATRPPGQNLTLPATGSTDDGLASVAARPPALAPDRDHSAPDSPDFSASLAFFSSRRAALRSALAFIFSGSRPKSEKCT